MRRKIIAVWMVILFLAIASITIEPVASSNNLYEYLIANFYTDTGAKNALTAIYLDYRLFDTIFETLLLLVSVIGIIYFSRHEGDY